MKKRPKNSAGYITPERIEAADYLTKILKGLVVFQNRLATAGLVQTGYNPLQIDDVTDLILRLLAIPKDEEYAISDVGQSYDRSHVLRILQMGIDERPLNEDRLNYQITQTLQLILQEAETITGHYDPLS